MKVVNWVTDGAMIIRAPGWGMGEMSLIEEGTASSQLCSCLERVGPSSVYQEPAWLASRVVMGLENYSRRYCYGGMDMAGQTPECQRACGWQKRLKDIRRHGRNLSKSQAAEQAVTDTQREGVGDRGVLHCYPAMYSTSISLLCSQTTIPQNAPSPRGNQIFKRTCQTSINAHPAQPTEARHRNRVEIITTLSNLGPEGTAKGVNCESNKRLHSRASRTLQSSARLEILWLL